MARKTLSVVILIVALGAILGGSLFIYMWMSSSEPKQPEISPARPTKMETPEPAAPPEDTSLPSFELPTLEASDVVLRTVAMHLSKHPRLAAWLAPDNLIRRFVASVDNVARGESPRPHLLFLDPGEGFGVEERGGEIRISAASFHRYDRMVAVFDSLDPVTTAHLYRRLEPLLDEAYAELGYPGARFSDALSQAIDRILAMPVPEDGDIAVERRITTYKFADPEVESLEPLAKHLLRMGPANLRKIQSKLLVLRTALTLAGAPAEETP